jgi:hypothetical protein
MGEANFPMAGKQTTPRLGKTNSFWIDRKKTYLAKERTPSEMEKQTSDWLGRKLLPASLAGRNKLLLS